MEGTWSKPRKIFHFDNLQDRSKETFEEFLANKLTIVQQAVAEFLLGESKNYASIVPLSRALQSILIRNSYSTLHQSLIKTFYSIYKQVLEVAAGQSNILVYLLAYYINRKDQYRTLFTILNNYLSPYAKNDRTTVEEKAYKILCQEIVSSSFADQVGEEMMAIIDLFRTTKDQNQMLSMEYQLSMIAHLGIYRHFDKQFLERSKIYFAKNSLKIVKNEQIFDLINQALRRETALNKILKPSENTVGYLQKQYIEEYYPFLIEHMDYLIKENNLQKLKMLWNFTCRLGTDQMNMLTARLKGIIKQIKIFLKEGEDISKILFFKEKLSYVISQCFISNKALQNILYNTIEEVLLDNEKRYSQALADKIFKDEVKQSEELIQQLFKLTPNKQRFVKEFQARFFGWILYGSVDNVYYQEGIVHMMKKECGNVLCKKIDRMVYDVWREGHLLYYQSSSLNFKCRLLSANDWPKFTYSNILLPDRMTEMIQTFENELKQSPEHASKELKWINELGTVQMTINNVASVFSQIEAALIFVLDKAIRPMKLQQLSQILQGKQSQIYQVLVVLVTNGIVYYNEMNHTYDINDENTSSYITILKEKHGVEQMKQNDIKDYSVIIDAAVVRILKKKKAMPKTEVSSFVLQQMVTMKPKMEQINESIERLQKRQFLQIDKNKGILHYRE